MEKAGWAAVPTSAITVDGQLWRGWRVQAWARFLLWKIRSPDTLTLWLPDGQTPNDETVIPLLLDLTARRG